jgi:Domain of unknown function (DUF4177)
MLSVACPSCGERGKIPANLVGARIKCKKCGQAFHVAPAHGKPHASAGAATTVEAAASSPAQPVHDGIAVEGLDAASWSLAPDQSSLVPAVAAGPTTSPEHQADASSGSLEAFTVHHGGPVREYKLLTSRDKLFEGKFDMARLEEALNHLARQGWTAKSMCLPHLKNFQGAVQEEVVVLLER